VRQHRLSWGIAASIAALACAWARGAETRSASIPPAGYAIDVFTTDDGLPSDGITDVVQTRDGWLWIGTRAGLARFDGLSFTVFDPRTTPALASAQCGAMIEGPDGALWITTMGGGITRYLDGRFEGFGSEQGVRFEFSGVLATDRAGRVWFGTNDPLHVYEDGRFRVLGPSEGVSLYSAQPILEDDTGAMWIASGDGVAACRDGTCRTQPDGFRSLAPHLPERFRRIPGAGGSWLVVSSRTLLRERGKEITPVPLDAPSPTDGITRVAEDQSGTLWVGWVEGGLTWIRGAERGRLTAADGLPGGAINALRADREGNLWVGTNGGLARIRRRAFTAITVAEGLRDERVWSLLEDRSGGVWIGTESALHHLQGRALTIYDVRDGLPGRGVVSILEDREGTLWFGTNGGLARKEGASFRSFTTKDGLTSSNVRALHQDPDGRLWIGTSTGGVNELGASGFRAWTEREGLASNWVRAIRRDREGALWIATTGGVSRLRDGVITSYTTRDGLPKSSVVCIHEDRDGHLWLGSANAGLARLRDGRFVTVGVREGLLDAGALSIQEEGEDFWIAGTKGVMRVPRRELDDVVEGRAKSVTCLSYGRKDGLPTPECNGGTQPSSWKGRDGRLWFPTPKGVAIVDPKDVDRSVVAPPAVIESVARDGVPVPAGEAWTLPPGTRRVDLAFTALSYTAPERVRFRYRLEGFDPDWVGGGSARRASYTNLRPGSYVFHVAASNDGGSWSEAPAARKLTIRPYFHETPLFYALAAAALGALAFVVHRARVRRVEARFAAVLAERNRIARELHDTVAQGFAGVAIQLDAAATKLEAGREDAKDNLDRARDLARGSLAEARRSVQALRPRLLETGDLVDAIETSARALTEGTGIEADVRHRGTRRRFAELVEGNLLRAAQEALSNAVRHSGCRTIRIELVVHRGSVELTVEDDGRGLAEEKGHDGMGLQGMRERVEQIGGSLSVSERPGGGTRVAIQVPA
jgi:signal transduction histidine kinase/ligand-binding sensor domain-containing protein